MATRLPQPGSDDGTWGNILNDFLSVAHNGDGTLKNGIVTDANIANSAAIGRTKLDTSTQSSLNKADTALQSAPVSSVNSQTGVVVLGTDDIDDTSAAHKFVTASDLTKLGNLSGTNTGDQDLTGLVSKTTTVNGHALTGNITLNAGDVGADTFGAAASVQAASLQITNDLSDLNSAGTARTNLGLGGAATLDVGTTTGTVAAGDDSRLTVASTAIQSVNGKTGTAVNLTASDVGALQGTESTTAPSSPATNDLWYDSSKDLWKRWDGSTWTVAGVSPTSLFVNSGDLLVGTGTGTGTILSRSSINSVLTVTGTQLAWKTPTIGNNGFTLSGTTALSNSTTTLFTWSVGTGAYLVNYQVSAAVATGTPQTLTTQIVFGTAAGSVRGPNSTTVQVINSTANLNGSAVLYLTSAGTLMMQATVNAGTMNANTTTGYNWLNLGGA